MLYLIRQNNSGGRFHKPAVSVFIEGDTPVGAQSVAERHIPFCGMSGRYADYDDCGCCPCCGHRWSPPDDWDKATEETAEHYFTGEAHFVSEDGLEFMGSTAFALIKADGSLLVGDTVENYNTIKEYVTYQVKGVK